jgi:hypothetical protein
MRQKENEMQLNWGQIAKERTAQQTEEEAKNDAKENAWEASHFSLRSGCIWKNGQTKNATRSRMRVVCTRKSRPEPRKVSRDGQKYANESKKNNKKEFLKDRDLGSG